MIKMYVDLHVEYPLFLSDCIETWIWMAYFRKTFKYQIEWKSIQWEPNCSMRTDGRAVKHDETNSRFSQFCERT